MKQIKYLLCIILCLTTCLNSKILGQESNSKFSNKATFISETLGLTHCESAVYDNNRQVIYASLIGNREAGDGSIAKLDLDGKLIDKAFVSNLNDPKGIAITDDRLFVSDVTELIEANLETGDVIRKYTLEGIKFLNDVAIDKSGNVFVSDTATSKIYQLDTEGNFTLWLADLALDKPNGLLIKNEEMFVASWGATSNGGRFSKVDMKSKSIKAVSDVIGNLDGIQIFDENQFIISDWRSGNIYLIDHIGNTKNVLTVGQSVGDIAYIKEQQLLLLPMNKKSRLLFYRLED